ncbi:glutamine synthetase family protein [Nocardioides aurantiacus]|uniref:glutamine synthetase family protein n=1 Tax=Nocardioides aurantiacus TaxID=86796 RepID=UPI00403F0631
MSDETLNRLRSLKTDGIDTLIIGAVDLNAQLRVKRFPLALFLDNDEVEIAISDYVFAADLEERLMVPRAGYDGYFPTAAQGVPDLSVRPNWDTIRVLPWEPGTALVLGDFHSHDGAQLRVAPRTVLRRVLRRLEDMGYVPMIGVEYEFLIFKGTLADAKANPSQLEPLSVGPAYGYTRAALDEQYLGPLRRSILAAGIPVEAINPEAAPGQFEITIRYDEALKTADQALHYRDFVKELLGKQGLTASFIAKYGELYGSSGHVHVSLRDTQGRPLMTEDDGCLSRVTQHAIGGYLHTVREMTAIYAPTINSYRRYNSDYSFAGDTVAWGLDNRTCGLRVIHTTPKSTRLESRVAGADMNPYLTLAALLAGIGAGLEKGIDPPPATHGDAYTASGVERVPKDLRTATELFEQSDIARDWLGDDFVDFYVETRLWEVNEHRLSISDWELRRHL